MKLWFEFLAFCALWMWSALAAAHHSYAAYARDTQANITGTVTKVGFLNPHAYYEMDVEDENGVVTNWTVELSAPAVLRRRGWDHTTIQVGDRITAVGAPLLNGRPEMNLDYFVLADGELLTRTEGAVTNGGAATAPLRSGEANENRGNRTDLEGKDAAGFLPEPVPSGAPRELLEGVWVTNVRSPYTNPRDPRGESIMTEAGIAQREAFVLDEDNMGNCRMVGTPRMARGTIYSQEFVDTGDIIYIISEYNSQTRRIYMEGQEPHQYAAPNKLGWSNGVFEDGVLTITTRNLTEDRIDGPSYFGGGEDAFVVERIFLTEDGSEMIYYSWFHDPTHYTDAFRTSQSWARIEGIDSGFALDCAPVFYAPDE